MMVRVGEFDARGDPVRRTTFTEPAAVFSNHPPAVGVLRLSQVHHSFLEFDVFTRDKRLVALQLKDGKETLGFTVDNPRPARSANWIHQDLPQTNHLSGTRIELRQLVTRNRAGSSFGELLPRARAYADGGGGDGLGWMRWRFTAVNPIGNWMGTQWSMDAGIPSFPPVDSTWKLVVEGEEFLSAGFVAQPASGSWRILPVNQRARELGARTLVLVGPGAYRFAGRDGGGVVDGSSIVLPKQSLKLLGPSGATNWVLEVNVSQIGILCLTEPSPGGAEIRARLRERDRENRPNSGTAYSAFVSMSATNTIAPDGRRRVAQFLVPRWTRPPLGWPDTDNQIEAEVIIAHPPTEFLVDPSKAGPPAGLQASPASSASDRAGQRLPPDASARP
jgi:hypothetical protein